MRHLITLTLLLGMGGMAVAQMGSTHYRLARHCFGSGADAAAAPSSGRVQLSELALEGPSGAPVASASYRCTPGYLQGGPGWLPAPTGLALTIGVDSLLLSWRPVPWARGYQVRSSLEGHAGFSPDASGSFSGANWSAPLPGERRFYQVKALR